MIKVLIADDQLLFRVMLEEMLKKDKDIEIVASCAGGEEAVKLSQLNKPDIVLLDIQMPDKTGVEALKDIKTHLPDTKVVMLTTFEDIENISAAYQLRADAYLVKDIKPDILIMAIKCIYNDIVLFHGSVFSAMVSSKMMLFQNTNDRVEIGDIVFDSVDVAIMKQIAEGKTNKDIARLLNYSEGTIKNRVSRILSTTGLSDRTEISVFAIKNQII
ncbi:response regulator transcription factor [Petroclostridium sp. X23]|jgi:DNA-binding NarL/FixJ family response regulator|uniref:response regulator transcription factor n=1 Tax=Petroclostridium sp. X23 TaxID=3045146 RepID=UPI0024ADF2C1|nr:response regulator transcription factor [Petroclostridium sp. X23]WHH61344.1 response regulator transcription factor [Petroclostridium sp. X23]